MELKPYNPDARCPKCGGEIDIGYRLGSIRRAWSLCSACQDGIEHLHRTCRVCGYSWPEACVDMKAQPQLTPEQERAAAKRAAEEAERVRLWELSNQVAAARGEFGPRPYAFDPALCGQLLEDMAYVDDINIYQAVSESALPGSRYYVGLGAEFRGRGATLKEAICRAYLAMK